MSGLLGVAFFFFFGMYSSSRAPPTLAHCAPYLQTLIQGQPTAVEKQQMLSCRLGKNRDLDAHDHICVWV